MCDFYSVLGVKLMVSFDEIKVVWWVFVKLLYFDWNQSDLNVYLCFVEVGQVYQLLKDFDKC